MRRSRLRFGLRRIMLAVVVIAANLSVLRASFPEDEDGHGPAWQHVQALLPVGNLLAATLILTARQLRRSGRCRPAYLGVQVFGWWSVLLYFGCATLAGGVFEAYRDGALEFVKSAGLFDPGRGEGDGETRLLNAIPFLCLGYWLPQLIIATVGGSIFSLAQVTLCSASTLEAAGAWERVVAEMGVLGDHEQLSG